MGNSESRSDRPSQINTGERLTPNSEEEARQAVKDLNSSGISSLRLEQVSLSTLVELAHVLKTNATLIELSTYEVCDNAAAALAKALLVNKTLQSLCLITPDDMRYKFMSSKGVKTLCKALEANVGLVKLQILGNLLELPACEALAKALTKNGSLRVLELAGCGFGDAGVAPFASMLETNQFHLTKLVIRRCSIQPEGGASFARALRTNTTLRNFQLFDRYLGDLTLQHFGNLLELNTPLTCLKLYSMYDCTPAGVSGLIDGLGKNTSLRVFSLSGTTISPSEQPWARAMATNQTLQKLDLEDCGISPSDACDLLWSLRANGSLQKLCINSQGVSLEDESVLLALSSLLQTHPALIKLSVGLSPPSLEKLQILVAQSGRIIELE